MSGEKREVTEKVYREEGVALLLLRCSEEPILPLATPCADRRLDAFCTEMKKEVIAFAERECVPALRAAYLSDENPKKRFTVRPQILTFTRTFGEEENTLILSVTCTLSFRGKVLTKTEKILRFDKETGFLLPSKKKIKRRAKKTETG